jgi:hypothetical protein
MNAKKRTEAVDATLKALCSELKTKPRAARHAARRRSEERRHMGLEGRYC